MNRVFLSHSSIDKDFVRKVKDALGDIAIIDEVDFNAGARTIDEIIEKIADSKIFVAFLSQKALESEWVQKELALAIEYSERKGMLILVFSVDKSVVYSNKLIPENLSKHYNIRYVKNSNIVISRIRDGLRRLSFIQSPATKKAETLFIGRADQIRKFETDFSSIDGVVPSFIVASNFYAGMGRRHFLKHILNQIDILKQTETPITISMQKGESIENFIIKLNSVLFDDEASKAELGELSLEAKYKLLLRLVLDYKKNNRIIFIIDEGSIVLPNHEVVDWFDNLVQAPVLHNRITFCLISSWDPHHSFLMKNNPGASYHIKELDNTDTQNLFLRLLNIYGNNNLSLDLKKEFISHLTGIPSQIKFAVQQIRALGSGAALLKIEEIKQISDSYSLSLIDAIKKNRLAYQLCLVLSNEPISLDVVSDVFGESEELGLAINYLLDYSALDFLSDSVSYIKLNPTLADFIKRQGLKPDPEIQQKFQHTVNSYVAQSLDTLALEDYSKFTLALEECIRNGEPIPDKYCIAPFLLNNIIKEYRAGNYKIVEGRCLELLRQTNFDRQVMWELHYHLVLVYARTARDEFWDALKESPLDYIDREFLKGFYYRNKKDPADIKKALDHFQNVLTSSPNHRRARREIVNTYILLDDYPNALKYAKENYEQYPSDILHLHSYFVALIRNDDFNPLADYKILDSLMDKAKTNLDSRANDILQCMKGEYEYWINNDFTTAEHILKEAKRTNENRRYPLKALLIIYRKEGMFEEAREIKKELSQL